jgi:hypothetical protein
VCFKYTLREALAKAGVTIPDQKGKPTNKPRLKWVYFLFWGVHELRIEKETETRELVINVNALLKEQEGFIEILLNSMKRGRETEEEGKKDKITHKELSARSSSQRKSSLKLGHYLFCYFSCGMFIICILSNTYQEQELVERLLDSTGQSPTFIISR